MRCSLPRCILFAWSAALLVVLPGCDLFGSGKDDDPGVEGVPPERLVAMVAVWDDGKGGDKPVHRLVVADFDDPAARYDVLRKAGEEVQTTCFSPDKRRILFADNSGSITGGRSAMKLYNLDSGEVRALDGAPTAATYGGTSMRCVWSADGSGFYYMAAGAAGAAFSMYYDVETKQARPFGIRETAGGDPVSGVFFFGLKGQDTLIVRSQMSEKAPDSLHYLIDGYHYVDAQTEKYLGRIKNEHLKFIPWEDKSRGGFKRAAYSVTYDGAPGLIAFMRKTEEERSLAVTDLEGSFVKDLTTGGPLYMDLAWKGRSTLLFSQGGAQNRPRRIYVANVETGEVRSLVEPNAIDGAIRLTEPDY